MYVSFLSAKQNILKKEEMMKGFSLWTSFILENKQGLVEPITFVFSLIEVFFLIKNINPRKKKYPWYRQESKFFSNIHPTLSFDN